MVWHLFSSSSLTAAFLPPAQTQSAAFCLPASYIFQGSSRRALKFVSHHEIHLANVYLHPHQHAHTCIHTHREAELAGRQLMGTSPAACSHSSSIFHGPGGAGGSHFPRPCSKAPSLLKHLGIARELPCAGQHSAARCPRFWMKKEK